MGLRDGENSKVISEEYYDEEAEKEGGDNESNGPSSGLKDDENQSPDPLRS